MKNVVCIGFSTIHSFQASTGDLEMCPLQIRGGLLYEFIFFSCGFFKDSLAVVFRNFIIIILIYFCCYFSPAYGLLSFLKHVGSCFFNQFLKISGHSELFHSLSLHPGTQTVHMLHFSVFPHRLLRLCLFISLFA